MKRLMSVVLSMVVVLMMCGGAMAEEFYAQGGAIVPNLMYKYNRSDSWSLPYIVLTNITNDIVKCQLRVYDADGLDITSRGSFRKGGVNNWTNVSAGGDVEIPPHASRMYAMGYGSSKMYTIGHAEIQWSSIDTRAKAALVGGVTIRKKDGYVSNIGFLINQGNPF